MMYPQTLHNVRGIVCGGGFCRWAHNALQTRVIKWLKINMWKTKINEKNLSAIDCSLEDKTCKMILPQL